MSILDPLLGSLVTAALQRTYLMQTLTGSGIPRILVVFDAITSEEPEFVADVTEHPVEQGTEVSDHIQLKNPTLKLVGTISNSPIDLATSIGNIAAAGIDLITSSQARDNILNSGIQQASGLAGATLLGNAASTSGFLGGATDAIARTVLLTAYQNKLIFDVVTKRYRYQSMVIESLRFPRDSSTGYQVVFELDMKAIRIVSPQVIPINSTAQDVVNQAASPNNLGNQAATGVSSQTSSAVNGSWLRSIVGGFH